MIFLGREIVYIVIPKNRDQYIRTIYGGYDTSMFSWKFGRFDTQNTGNYNCGVNNFDMYLKAGKD